MQALKRAWSILQRRGARGAFVHITMRGWNRLFRHRQVIYRLPKSEAVTYRPMAPSSTHVTVYRSFAEIPAGLAASLLQSIAEIKATQRAFEDGAILFVVILEELPAATLWAKPGSRIKRWYVPLAPSDVVLFEWETAYTHRGRGLIGAALGSAFAYFASETDQFFADVKTWNRSSIRAMEKAGFRIVTQAKPLR